MKERTAQLLHHTLTKIRVQCCWNRLPNLTAPFLLVPADHTDRVSGSARQAAPHTPQCQSKYARFVAIRY